MVGAEPVHRLGGKGVAELQGRPWGKPGPGPDHVLGVGARVVGSEMAKMILEEFLSNSPEGGRHATRVDMIREIEAENGLYKNLPIYLSRFGLRTWEGSRHES